MICHKFPLVDTQCPLNYHFCFKGAAKFKNRENVVYIFRVVIFNRMHYIKTFFDLFSVYSLTCFPFDLFFVCTYFSIEFWLQSKPVPMLTYATEVKF